MSRQALTGVRVLDLTRVIAGPWATQILADLGAEVIKVERPIVGDDARRFGPVFLNDADGKPTDESACYLSYNRNKRSVTVNIAEPEGQDIIRELAGKSDVLVENYKVGDLDRYRLDYASLSAANPRLVYCSITGFGQTGPYKERAGYDPIFQAMGGLMSITGLPDGVPGGGPMKVGPPIADLYGGFYAAIAILAALHERDHGEGRGQHIDLGLLDSLVATLSKEAMNWLVGGHITGRAGTEALGGGPSGAFQCADGTVMCAVGSDDQFARMCRLLGLSELPSEPRFASGWARAQNRPELRRILEERTRTFKVVDLLERFSEAGIAGSRVNDIKQVFEDPQVKERGMTVRTEHPLRSDLALLANPMRFSRTPVAEYRAPPLLGEHTREVLAEVLGFDAARIEQLSKKGVL
jgi:crotonobetainyl-CoA:carnitine CoA-transferase CaiB-like acyl-CoA transferase